MTESPIYSVRTEEEVAREILAGTDIASLPRDYPLDKLAEEVMAEVYKSRAEIERLKEALAEREKQFSEALTIHLDTLGRAKDKEREKAVEAEREACAGVCEGRYNAPDFNEEAVRCADAIRARGKT